MEQSILFGLGLAITLNASKIKIHNDSQLVVGQILKEYEAKDERMAKYLLTSEPIYKRGHCLKIPSAPTKFGYKRTTISRYLTSGILSRQHPFGWSHINKRKYFYPAFSDRARQTI